MKNKLISLVFIICIFTFGIVSIIKAAPYIKEDISGKQYVDFFSTFDDTFTNRFACRRQWVNINGLFQKSILKTYIEDNEADVFLMDNNMLCYGADQLPKNTLAYYASQVSDLSKELPVLYVSLPFKIRHDDNILPAGVAEYANDNADTLLSYLKAFNVNFMDLRTNFDKLSNYSGEKYYNYFFRTDQHWTNEASLYAANCITKKLSKEFGFSYDKSKLNVSNFTRKVYRDWFLGSFGKKTGSWYDGTDDYELLTPSFDTKFSFRAYSETGIINRSGSFNKALLDLNNLKKDLFKNNTYETYTGGNYKLTKVINHQNKKGKKLLLIRDSFSCSMMPFLSLACHELDAIDPRSFDKTSIYKFAKRGNYDAVIIAYNPTIYGEKAFAFK